MTPIGSLRRSAVLAAVLASALVTPPSPPAGTVSVSESPSPTVTFAANPGEVNRLEAWVEECEEDESCALAAMFTDSGAPLSAGAGCEQVNPASARCSFGDWGASSRTLRVVLGDGADWASVANACTLGGEDVAVCRATVDGGDGDDTLIGTRILQPVEILRGGAGDDELAGGTYLDGGAGADTIRGRVDADSALRDDDRSKAVYRDRLAPVYVTLNGLRDDGEAGERDLVVAVSGIVGGSGHDVLVGDSAGTTIFAGEGNDVVRGRGDRNLLTGGLGADRMWGGDGPDFVFGGLGADTIHGGGGADELSGDAGADTITGGGGRDTLNGRAGNDVFYSRDGYRDMLRGGTGWDRARIDRGLDAAWSIARFF